MSYLHDFRALCPFPRAGAAQNKHNLRLHHRTDPVHNPWNITRQPLQQPDDHTKQEIRKSFNDRQPDEDQPPVDACQGSVRTDSTSAVYANRRAHGRWHHSNHAHSPEPSRVRASPSAGTRTSISTATEQRPCSAHVRVEMLSNTFDQNHFYTCFILALSDLHKHKGKTQRYTNEERCFFIASLHGKAQIVCGFDRINKMFTWSGHALFMQHRLIQH